MLVTAFRVAVTDADVEARLSLPVAATLLRRTFRFPIGDIRGVSVRERGPLEALIDHRVLGVGWHRGDKRPGWYRVGRMLGREVVGEQFWAVRSGGPDRGLLVLDMASGRFGRAVLEVDDPHSLAATLG